jgi:uncharacterized protein YprB with RNaseH-like and TPR domain
MEHLKEILFVDIETVSAQPEYGLLSEILQAEWIKKTKVTKTMPDGLQDPALLYHERAGIYSEFAKVVCIGFGSLQQHDGTWRMRLKSLTNDNERVLLSEFADIAGKFHALHKDMKFCGHNIREFDIPFLCRRMVINNISLPQAMQMMGKKPWEVPHLDTMEMWRFGDYKNYTSLSLLAEILGIPSPKSDMDGSMVSNAFWQDRDLDRIGRYCLQDVLTSARVYLRLKGITGMDIEPVYVS